MHKTLLFFFSILIFQAAAQTTLTIPQIQGNGASSPYISQKIKTTGIVTAKFIGSGKIGGYFLQDVTGDGNTATSDGVFVSTSTDNVAIGDKINLTGTVSENSGRTQIGSITAQTLVSSGNQLPATKVQYNPDNFNWEQYEGMLVDFDQVLYVNSNYNLQQFGQLSLYPSRIFNPTNQALPGSADYFSLITANSKPQILLDDGITTTAYKPLPLADAYGTRRTGERVKNLIAVVDYTSGKYVLYPASTPVFYGNSRPIAPALPSKYNLKVCASNLEIYLTTNFGQGYGPDSEELAARQHTKIMAALLAIDADIYGLIEIEQGQEALKKIVNALNTATVAGRYTYVNDGGTINGTYTKVGYVYRTDKVTPYLSIKNNDSPSPLRRKKAQAFTLKSNNERFIFSLNHFKAKSGCSSATGDDADQGDGQSCYNATRVAESNSTLNFLRTNKTYYSDADVLIMGDLNAYGKEDPITTLIAGGYTDLHSAYHADSSYSYVYNNQAGYLDNALASSSLKNQVAGLSVFHVNADEPAMFEYSGSAYQPDMYRYSDHDPVMVYLNLGEYTDIPGVDNEDIKLFPTLFDDYFTVTNAAGGTLEIYTLNGVKILQQNIENNENHIDISSLKLLPGAYIVRIDLLGKLKRMIIFKK